MNTLIRVLSALAAIVVILMLLDVASVFVGAVVRIGVPLLVLWAILGGIGCMASRGKE